MLKELLVALCQGKFNVNFQESILDDFSRYPTVLKCKDLNIGI